MQAETCYNTHGYIEKIMDFESELSPGSFKSLPDFVCVPEKLVGFQSFKFFNEILSLTDNALIKEINALSSTHKDARWIESNVLLLQDKQMSLLEFFKNSLKYEGGYSLGLRYVYVLLLSFSEMKLIEIKDA